jgi:hypothetical protein
MYISHEVMYRIFTIELVTKEPVSTDEELFKKIAGRLFENKVITKINVDNLESYTVNGKQVSRFDIHLCNTHKPSAVRLTNVEKALQGLLDNHEYYSEMQIKLN